MKRLGTILAVLALLTVPAAANATIESTEVCVTLYENINAGGDHIQWCDLVPTGAGLHDADLSNNTAGLFNGCAKTGGTNPNWNDCVSSAHVANLPASYRVRWYYGANYSLALFCDDTNGSRLLNTDGFYNDTISSWRIEGGNC